MLGNFRLCKGPSQETLKKVGLFLPSTGSPETEIRNPKRSHRDGKT